MYRLRKNLVIPAGTIFRKAPRRSTHYDGSYEYTVGLTDNSSGMLIYGIDTDDKDLMEQWFEKAEPEKKE